MTDSEATREIRTIIDDRIIAVRAKDPNGLIANTATDVVTFDVVNPLRNAGSNAVQQRALEWFSSFEGPIGYEVRDLNITMGDGVAFCYFLNRVNATTTAGKWIDMWWRATICFRKTNGKWMITHEHDSVPFDMETGVASVDLKP